MSQQLLCHRDGSLGRITLNRPKALNAVTLDMVRGIQQALNKWRDDPSVVAVAIDAAGDRAFAAGGDLRGFWDARPDGPNPDPDYGPNFWREEYALIADIAEYPKPYVAIMSGIIMGGGVGIAAHGSHRVVTETTRFTMPETGIGLIPDVGGTWLLTGGRPRQPNDRTELREHHAHAVNRRTSGQRLFSDAHGAAAVLFGIELDASDTLQAGAADAHVPSDNVSALLARLAAIPPTRTGEDAMRAVDNAIREYATTPRVGDASVPDMLALAVTEAPTPADLATRLECASHPHEAELAPWAERLRPRSPFAFCLAFAALRAPEEAKPQSLRETLVRDYALACRCLRDGDFLEGIRAFIADKDRAPRWAHTDLGAVTLPRVETCFSLPPDTPPLMFLQATSQ